MKNKGLSMHCHHDRLVEYCYDYDERVQYIKYNKPKNEILIRLQVFKLLSKEAIRELPIECRRAEDEWRRADDEYRMADAVWQKAYAVWRKANAAWRKANAKWENAYAKQENAYAKRENAYAVWSLESQEIFHKKWCGCEYWKNGKLEFS